MERPRTVTSEEVGSYRGFVGTIAQRFVGSHGAEFDDLEQEGWIAAWRVLCEERFRPSEKVIVNACRMWVRKCARHGLTGVRVVV